MELKTLQIDHVEFKTDEAREGFFCGWASQFGGVDSYGDTVVKGAYTETLQNRKRPVQLRWNHYGAVIGKYTLIEERDKGLWVEGEFTPGHSVAQDVYASVKHGSVTGLSIGYRVKSFEQLDSGIRLLKEIELVEISVVESPADLNATIGSVKSLIDDATSMKEIESLLREHNFSRSDATGLIARVKSIARGEREQETKSSNDDVIAELTALTQKLRGL